MKVYIKLFLIIGMSFGSLFAIEDLVIRSATFDDSQQIADLYIAVTESCSYVTRTKEECTQEWAKNIINAKGLFLVAEIIVDGENKIIGILSGSKLNLTKMNHVMSNMNLMVHPHFQKQGVAKTLVEEFQLRIKEKLPEIKRVEIGVFESNKKAHEWYKKLGFIEEGRLTQRVQQADGTYDDQILMYKFISS